MQRRRFTVVVMIMVFFVLTTLYAYAALNDCGYLTYPMWTTMRSPSDTDLRLDDGTNGYTKASYTLMCPDSGSILKVYFYVRGVTTGGTLKVSLQDPDTSTDYYRPDGTIDQSGTVSVSSSYSVYSVTFDSSRSVSKGDWLCIVFEWDTTPGDINLALGYSYNRIGIVGMVNRYDGTSWSATSNFPKIGLEYSDGYCRPVLGCDPPVPVESVSFNSSSTPDERGNKLVMQFSGRCIGMFAELSTPASGSLILYDSSDNVLGSVDLDQHQYLTGGRGITVYFQSSVILEAGNTYRIVYKPSTTTNVTLYDYTGFSASTLRAFPGGQYMQFTSRSDSGSWTDDATKLAIIGVILDQLSDDSGGTSGGYSYGVFR